MIKQVKGIDGRERVLLPLKTVEEWCRAYFKKHGITLPQDFIVELKLSESTVCSFENEEQEKRLEN